MSLRYQAYLYHSQLLASSQICLQLPMTAERKRGPRAIMRQLTAKAYQHTPFTILQLARCSDNNWMLLQQCGSNARQLPRLHLPSISISRMMRRHC